jgi:hypothetical protein
MPAATCLELGQTLGHLRFTQPEDADVALYACARNERRDLRHEMALEQMRHLARNPGKEVTARRADLDAEAWCRTRVIVERACAGWQIGLLLYQ